jgi:hypothetical protein
MDKSRGDGRSASCLASRRTHYSRTYVHKPRPDAGRRFKPARDGDRQQARRRIDHLIAIGRITDPDKLPCVDCGHSGTARRHEYDHYLGYAAEHHEHVEPVCSKCHATRSIRRGENAGRNKVRKT